MRKGTTITIAILLLVILGAATYQLFFLAERGESDPRPHPAPVTSTTLG